MAFPDLPITLSIYLCALNRRKSSYPGDVPSPSRQGIDTIQYHPEHHAQYINHM